MAFCPKEHELQVLITERESILVTVNSMKQQNEFQLNRNESPAFIPQQFKYFTDLLETIAHRMRRIL